MTDTKPVEDVHAARFWAGCRAGRLEAQRCDRCGHLRFPPAGLCPECLSDGATWEVLSGYGSVLSYVTFERAYHSEWEDRVPYNVSLIQLDEGPRMFSNVEDDPDPVVAVDMRVAVDFIERDGAAIPIFRPVS